MRHEGLNRLLRSRRFWVFVFSGLTSVILYFVSKYYSAYLEDVNVILGFVNGLAALVILVYTYDDAEERRIQAYKEIKRVEEE